MAKTLTNIFLVNGTPLYAPDNEMSMSYEDIDTADTGRDETGYMIRNMVREKVGTYSFVYSAIDDDEYRYIESVFDTAGSTFSFTRPNRVTGESETTTCYRSKYSIAWYSAREGKWKNYKFNIIEC